MPMNSSQQIGKYLIRNWRGFLILKWVDLLCSLLPKKEKTPLHQPKRFLICQIAHLGDVILATCLIPVLKTSYPNCEINFLVGSHSKDVVKDHPDVKRLYIFDHWKLNRSKISLAKKLLHHFITSRDARKKIKETNIDVAIDLYPYFPNAIHLLWRAKIPSRIGFTSGGFGPLLTHPHEWASSNLSILDYQRSLLKALKIDDLTKLQISLPDAQAPVNLRQLNYIVCHPGSGNPLKEWSKANWKQLAKMLTIQGHHCMFTGKGEREKKIIEEIIKDIPNCLDLSDELSWKELTGLIFHSKLLISVDSASIHIAAAKEIPTIVLYCGINNPSYWAPRHEKTITLMEKVPCAPCHKPLGCESMRCIQGISAKRVFDSAVHLSKISGGLRGE